MEVDALEGLQLVPPLLERLGLGGHLQAPRLQLRLLGAEKQVLEEKVCAMKALSEDLESQVHSLFYRVNSRKALRDGGAIDDRCYAQPVPARHTPSQFPSRLDLRSGDVIDITAEAAHVARIKRVPLIPHSLFRDRVDYSVTISLDGQTARLMIYNREKFRAERSVMVLVN